VARQYTDQLVAAAAQISDQAEPLAQQFVDEQLKPTAHELARTLEPRVCLEPPSRARSSPSLRCWTHPQPYRQSCSSAWSCSVGVPRILAMSFGSIMQRLVQSVMGRALPRCAW